LPSRETFAVEIEGAAAKRSIKSFDQTVDGSSHRHSNEPSVRKV